MKTNEIPDSRQDSVLEGEKAVKDIVIRSTDRIGSWCLDKSVVLMLNLLRLITI